MTSFISSLEIIDIVIPDPNIFLWIAVSVADAAAVNSNGIKTLLASGLRIFIIKGDRVFSSGPKILIKNSSDCHILSNWVFYNFILAEELSGKVLRSF